MIKIFQKAFKITNENIILTTPLVLFLFLLSLYLGVAQRAPENVVSAVLLLVTILFMISAFFAGWFYMVKKAIDLDKQEFIIEEDKAKASFHLIKEVPVGIGEYFFPLIGALIFYGFIFVLMVVICYKLGMQFIGDAGLTLSGLKAAMATPATMKAMLTSMSHEQLRKLNSWNLLFLVATSIYSFLTMFWGAEIVNKTKNPFLAFFRAIKFTSSHFLSAIILFVYISFINFMVSLLNAFSVINPIVYFISMLLYFYFVVYVVVLVFLYYDKEHSDKFRPETIQGACVQDNCVAGDGQCDCASQNDSQQGDSNSGADSFGQDKSGDSSGEDQ